ncbi:MAG: M67 family metallopeptidase [Bacteroides sp.]|nr:M67 family metallopeptidase [Bacteroides sp.]
MKIKRELMEEIVSQARRELPDESCGYLLGEEGLAMVNYPMTNADHSPEHFSFVPQEQFAAIKSARKRGLKVVGNWHSHPSSPSRPSVEDIRLAYDPDITYFILSLASEEPVLNAFRIVNGEVEKLELEITS